MKKLMTLTAALLSSSALAHSGHGLNGGDSSLLHYLSEPEHVAGVVLLVVVIAGVVGWRRRRSNDKV